jgi:gas vesicle structural protein
MAIERASGGTSLIDVLDRVLDKGIVIDAWVRVSLVGIDLITVEARIVVASIDTYLKYSEAVGAAASASRPIVEAKRLEELENENEDLRAEIALFMVNPTKTSGSSGTPRSGAAGKADLVPRAQAGRYRKPID